jgi:cytochrome c-type biogenesis protein CcmH/NrfF
MHSPTSLWWVAPLMSLVIGVILVSEGLWRSARHDSVLGKELSKARISRVRAVLVSSGLFLAIIGASLALGLMKR